MVPDAGTNTGANSSALAGAVTCADHISNADLAGANHIDNGPHSHPGAVQVAGAIPDTGAQPGPHATAELRADARAEPSPHHDAHTHA